MTIPARIDSWDNTFNGAVFFKRWDDVADSDMDVVDDWLAIVRMRFGADTDFVQFETWQQLTEASVPQMMSQRPLAIAGGVQGGHRPFCVSTMTFKTSAGGRVNYKFVEAAASIESSLTKYQNLNDSSGLHSTDISIRNYILSSAHPFTGRDNARPILALNVSTKINDTLRKRAMRLGEIA
jgi:hypothetical protein